MSCVWPAPWPLATGYRSGWPLWAGRQNMTSTTSFESWFLLHLRDGLPAMATCADVCKEISSDTNSSYGREYHKKSKNNQDLYWLISIILPFTKEAIQRSKRIATSAFARHQVVPDQSGTKVHELVEVLWKASPKGARPDSSPKEASGQDRA